MKACQIVRPWGSYASCFARSKRRNQWYGMCVRPHLSGEGGEPRGNSKFPSTTSDVLEGPTLQNKMYLLFATQRTVRMCRKQGLSLWQTAHPCTAPLHLTMISILSSAKGGNCIQIGSAFRGRYQDTVQVRHFKCVRYFGCGSEI